MRAISPSREFRDNWNPLLPSPVSGFVEHLRAANEAGRGKPLPNDADEDAPYFTTEARDKFMSAFEAGNESIRLRFRPDLKRLCG